MPGFPLLLVSTDILAEGEDLHTYCRNVYHYGITWTPSSMEQRTGRVDRINGLLQRRLDGRADPPTPDELLQVYFPHLADTVEVLQVKRVLNRLDRFIEMVYAMKQDHMTAHHELDVATDMLAATEARAPEQRLLESAYPPTPQWMSGELTKPAVDAGSVVPVEKALGGYWKRLVRDLHIEDQTPAGSPRRFAGVLPLPVQGQARCEPGTGDESKRKQRVELSLRSQPVGGATLLRCTSVARRVPKKKLDVSGLMERLIRLQQRLDMARIYAIDDEAEKMSEVGVTCDRMVHIDSGQFDEVEELVTSTATAADRLERFMEMEIDGLEADMDWQCSSIGSNSETTD